MTNIEVWTNMASETMSETAIVSPTKFARSASFGAALCAVTGGYSPPCSPAMRAAYSACLAARRAARLPPSAGSV